MGFGEHQVGFGWFWNGSMVLGNFLPVLLVMPFLGGLFLTCFGVSVGFRCVFGGHHGGKGLIVGFGELRVGLGGLLGWIHGIWRFLSFLVVILFFFGVFLTCFGVSVGFCLVLVRNKYKWDWIVGFGEAQVSFGWFSWEFLSFCCFLF